jgi:membrane-bound lytic murein transglycosylase D
LAAALLFACPSFGTAAFGQEPRPSPVGETSPGAVPSPAPAPDNGVEPALENGDADEDAAGDVEWMREIEEFAEDEFQELPPPPADRYSEFEGGETPGRAHVRAGAVSDYLFSTAALDDGRVGRLAPRPFAPGRGRLALPYDIPVVTNQSVEDHIHFFQGRGRKHFARWLQRSGRYIPLLKPILKEYKLPEDTVYLAMIESGFSPYALSRSAAVGIWQFIPRTGMRYGLTIDFWRDERRDPVKATHAAARFLRDLYNYFGSWWLAWAGYNSGEGKIFKALKKYDTDDFWEISATRFFRKETRNYVPKLIAAALIAKNPERYGFEGIEYHPRLDFDLVEVPSPTDLRAAAAAAGVDLEIVRDLNPELRRGCTPANLPSYVMRVPKGVKEKFLAALLAMPPEERFKVEIHTAKKGETAASIAKAKGAKAAIVAEFNGIKDARAAIKAGTEIKVPKLYVPDEEMEERHDKKLKRNLERTARRKGKGKKVPAGEGGYVVQSGDNPWDIAVQHGVSVQDLLDENALDRSDRIYPGMKIKLPAKAKK